MNLKISLKNIVYLLFSIFLLNPACIKYYDDGFREDVFALPSYWNRVMSNSGQVFVNSDKELEIIFHSEKCLGAGYIFPFYASNGIYEISVTAKAERQEGHIFLYGYTMDYISNLTLGEILLPVSDKYTEYHFNVKMPEDGYIIELFLSKNDVKTNEGRLFVKNVRINHKLINTASIANHVENENNCCSPPYRKWERWQASEKQAFINIDNVMELRFDEKKWITSHYQLPFYISNAKIIIKCLAKANKQEGRLQVYDYTAKKVLISSVINISKEFKNYSVPFKTPEDKNHIIWIRFMQNNYRHTGGNLFVKKVIINNKILDITL